MKAAKNENNPVMNSMGLPMSGLFIRQRTNDTESKQVPDTEASERHPLPADRNANAPNVGKNSSPLHTIHSHGELSEAQSPLNNSSIEGPPKKEKKQRAKAQATAFADRLEKAEQQKKTARKDSLDDVSFGVDPDIYDDKVEGKPGTAMFISAGEKHKSNKFHTIPKPPSMNQTDARNVKLDGKLSIDHKKGGSRIAISVTNYGGSVAGGSSQGQGGSGTGGAIMKESWITENHVSMSSEEKNPPEYMFESK